jgi:large subunit ribosomal protein L15
MYALNELKPKFGSKKRKKRVARGESSGHGKTATRGTKGQQSRTGGGSYAGFEGGQMPIYRRLPKFGFTSLKSQVTAEVRLSELVYVEGEEVTLASLKAANVVRKDMVRARIILSGEIGRCW